MPFSKRHVCPVEIPLEIPHLKSYSLGRIGRPASQEGIECARSVVVLEGCDSFR